MTTGQLIGIAIGIFILTPLMNRILRKPMERHFKKYGYDYATGKKLETSPETESDTESKLDETAEYMPRAGDVFEGKINDLAQSDSKGWRRRDISFVKNEITNSRKLLYRLHQHQVTLIDSEGIRYELKFSEPENADRVCLGTPGKFKSWYQKKGFDDRSVKSDDKIYFEYTGQGMEFYVFTAAEYFSRKGDAEKEDQMGLLKRLSNSGSPAPKLPVHPDDEDLISEDDIQWWEALSLADCKAMEEQDHIAQYALFMKLTEEDGLSEEEASRRVRKTHLFFYGTLKQRENEPLGFKGDDAKLPYMLKDKANKAVIKFVRKMNKGERESASSINAIVRNLIRDGKV